MKRYLLILFFLIVLLACFSLYQYVKFSDGKLHVIFCDVGQGDAIMIRTPKDKTILVDGGPDNSVLDCLSGHMPFWQRTIDIAILTHPHADHFMGFLPVIDRYAVRLFATEKLSNNTAGYAHLQELLGKKGIPIRYIEASDRFKSNDAVILNVLGPTASYLTKTSPGGLIGEHEEFASLVLQLVYGSFDLLLTGDSQAEGVHNALDFQVGRQQINVLHVPHHGSKTGLDKRIFEKISPGLAVISVGKNKYGHPNEEILKILSDKDIKILRTDEHGDVEIVTDGNEFSVK